MFLAEGSPISGVNPRWMTNYNGAQMQYNLYSDAARTQIVGPPPSGGGYSGLEAGFVVPAGNMKLTPSFTVYGRVPAGQSLPATHGFQSQLNGSALYWAWSNTATPASCTSGTGANSQIFYTGVKATAPSGCSIALSKPADLDFGSTALLAANRDSPTTISQSCPGTTSWKMGLNNGVNALVNQRRMKSAAGNHVNYELYRDSSRTQRWGNDTAGGTDTVDGSGAAQTNPTVLTVYGRVPVQPLVPPGTYTDTITVTLSY